MDDSTDHHITARIDHLSSGVGCFDPVQVVARLRGAFPELIEVERDPLWETYEHFRSSTGPGADGARRIAFRDFQERGPKIMFKIPLPDGEPVTGTAERYWVLVSSPVEFPTAFRHRFTEFLGSLFLQPIQVSSDST